MPSLVAVRAERRSQRLSPCGNDLAAAHVTAGEAAADLSDACDSQLALTTATAVPAIATDQLQP